MILQKRPFIPWSLNEVILVLAALVLAGRAYSQWGSVLTEKGWERLTSFPLTEISNFFIGGLLQSLFIVLMVVLLVRVRHRSSLNTLGLSLGESSAARVLLEGLVGGILLMLGVALLALIIFSFMRETYQPQPFAEVLVQAANWKQLGVLMAVGSLFAPLGEELYFRGLLFGYLRQRLGPGIAIWLSGAVFAGMHLDLMRFIPLLFGGAGLAYIYQRTGSLYASIVAHAVWNTAMTLFIWWAGAGAGI